MCLAALSQNPLSFSKPAKRLIMHDHDGNPKDNFVMSGKQAGGDDREEAYSYSQTEGIGRQKSMKPVLVGGGILLVAVIVILMFLSGAPKTAERDLIKGLETRLKSIEEKLAKLEWIDTGMARLERKEKEMASISERMTQLEGTLNKKIDQVSKDLTRPAPKPAEPAAAKADAAPQKPASPVRTEKDVTSRVHSVQKGETIYGISRKYGIPAEQLMKLNKLGPKDVIKPGQQLVIGPAKAG
jgi:LysM repeat protein